MSDEPHRAHARDGACPIEFPRGYADGERVAGMLHSRLLHGTEPRELRHHFILLRNDASVQRGTSSAVGARQTGRRRQRQVDPDFHDGRKWGRLGNGWRRGSIRDLSVGQRDVRLRTVYAKRQRDTGNERSANQHLHGARFGASRHGRAAAPQSAFGRDDPV